MSGHSKWHSIKHKKAKVDAARGKVFTKIIKELTVAARVGGGDPGMNPRLRVAVSAAKGANMPAKNIENAIKKGTGEMPGVVYEDVVYEGYGPGGVAVYIDAVTDNKNRTVAEVRFMLSKAGGNLGENGSVAWMFERKGMITVANEKYTEDQLFELAIECGAEDMETNDDDFVIYSSFEDFNQVRAALEENEIEIESAEQTMIPKNTVQVAGKEAEQLMKLMTQIDDHDDIQNVYANFDIEDEEMERILSE
ncbi:MAG: YebC/PmpR family DNA-binding transcriptional regulator [Calditrichaeota bacterium]|nr:MAG: YebC/PmpR family DNA-binding transcriptional regulator [Calditrichota bacterium]MBL1206939.1 YebC/PmpR family DNA-binding transcriptional regulator [Calditrichota bacterium]NOG46766.1 YebC/PmpR family DNA-binding transcriptional regulator [Calditrichota bacterium]